MVCLDLPGEEATEVFRWLRGGVRSRAGRAFACFDGGSEGEGRGGELMRSRVSIKFRGGVEGLSKLPVSGRVWDRFMGPRLVRFVTLGGSSSSSSSDKKASSLDTGALSLDGLAGEELSKSIVVDATTFVWVDSFSTSVAGTFLEPALVILAKAVISL